MHNFTDVILGPRPGLSANRARHVELVRLISLLLYFDKKCEGFFNNKDDLFVFLFRKLFFFEVFEFCFHLSYAKRPIGRANFRAFVPPNSKSPDVLQIHPQHTHINESAWEALFVCVYMHSNERRNDTDFLSVIMNNSPCLTYTNMEY